MKYLIRSVKYFFYFAFWSTVIVVALVVTGMASGDINELFEGGYDALWKIAIFYALVAAVYPKLGFIRRSMYIDKDMAEIRGQVISFMEEKGYDFESEDGNCMTFRFRSMIGRITRMMEDRITICRVEGGYMMEGLRKDVMKTATGMEYRLRPQDEE